MVANDPCMRLAKDVEGLPRPARPTSFYSPTGDGAETNLTNYFKCEDPA